MSEEQVAQAEQEAAPVEVKDEQQQAEGNPEAGEQKAQEKTYPPNRKASYTYEEMNEIVAAAKRNERKRVRKEVEAYYKGRDSMRPDEPPPWQAHLHPQKDKTEQPPERGQFEDYESFMEAKAAYAGRRAAEEFRQTSERESAARAAAEKAAQTAKSFQEKVAEKYPDLPDRIDAIGHIPMPAGMTDAIATSDFGPDILNHFAENPKDFERIAALEPHAALREIGKLEARLEAAAKKHEPVKEAKPSQAPAPIKPVGGTAASADDEPSADKPEAWLAWRKRQLAKRMRRTA